MTKEVTVTEEEVIVIIPHRVQTLQQGVVVDLLEEVIQVVRLEAIQVVHQEVTLEGRIC